MRTPWSGTDKVARIIWDTPLQIHGYPTCDVTSVEALLVEDSDMTGVRIFAIQD